MIEALSLASGFTVGVPMVLLAIIAARRVGLVDVPDGRKRHLGEVPLAGGLAVFVTVAIVMAIAVSADLPSPPWVVAAMVLSTAALALGILDDYHDLNAKLRLVVQIAIALVLAIGFDVRLIWLGDVLGIGSVGFEQAGSVLFTVFCIVGVVNATNMMDGMNGLLAAVASVSFVAIGALSMAAGDVTTPILCAAFVGALGAFLVFNLGAFGDRRRLFLGDSGSMMLGFVLATLLVGRSQGYGTAITPVAAGWLLGLPLLDAAVVMVRRLRERRSPLAAGRDHLHHRLQNLGLSPGRSLLVMVALQVAMVSVGMLAHFSALPPWIFFYGFVALAIVCFLLDFGLNERRVPGAGHAVGRETLYFASTPVRRAPSVPAPDPAIAAPVRPPVAAHARAEHATRPDSGSAGRQRQVRDRSAAEAVAD